MKVERIGQEYFITRTRTRNTKNQTSRDWFLIKSNYEGRAYEKGYLNLKYITFPEELIGKRIRIKIEVIKDEKEYVF